MVFLLVFFFWDSYDSNVGAFNIFSEVSEIVLISFNSFFFFPVSFISTILSSTSLILSSAYVVLLLVPSRVFLILFIALFIIYWLFFFSFRSLLNISCIFSILVSRLFICDSTFISRFWISFTISIWNSLEILIASVFGILYQVDSLSLPLLFGLVGISPVPLPVVYSSISSSCSYCFIWGGRSVFWKFVEFSLLWSFLTGGTVPRLFSQGFPICRHTSFPSNLLWSLCFSSVA